jgi:N-acetylglucosamine-6-phosphate deacetylase
MSPFLHRDPGIIGAAADSAHVMAEIICDGLHVHESAVRAAFKIFSPERIILISDNISSCGLPSGTYEYRDETHTVNGRLIRLPDGTIAGSGTALFDCVKMAVSFGIPLEDAVRCATYNPAAAIGALERAGTIEDGKIADFIICGENFDMREVYLRGVRVV